MSRLNNYTAEQTARELVRNGFNKTQAYIQTHPNASQNVAEKNAHAFMENYGVEARAIEIAESHENLSLNGAVTGLVDDLNAKKYIVVNGKVQAVPDNSVIASTRQFLIKTVHGVGREVRVDVQDNRSITVNIENPAAIDQLSDITTSLKSLNAKTLEQDGEIGDE